MVDFFQGWQHKRKAYKKLPRVVRVVLAGLAFVLGPLGIVTMFTPLAILEVGSILIFPSLTILSFEFDWAYNLLMLLHRKLQHKTFRRRLTLFTLVNIAYFAIVLLTNLQFFHAFGYVSHRFHQWSFPLITPGI
jgi:uncharacterized membrane protein